MKIIKAWKHIKDEDIQIIEEELKKILKHFMLEARDGLYFYTKLFMATIVLDDTIPSFAAMLPKKDDNDINLIIIINPKMFTRIKLDKDKRKIVQHEILHLLQMISVRHKHIKYQQIKDPKIQANIENIVADLIINEWINLKEIQMKDIKVPLVTMETIDTMINMIGRLDTSVSEAINYDRIPKIFEAIVNFIDKHIKLEKRGGSGRRGNTPADSSEANSHITKDFYKDKEITKEFKEELSKAKEKFTDAEREFYENRERHIGTLPGNIEQELNRIKLLRNKKLNIFKYIKKFLTKHKIKHDMNIEHHYKYTEEEIDIESLNTLGIIQEDLGFINDPRKNKLYIFLDTSGSMGDTEIHKLLRYIFTMSYKYVIKLVQIDTEIQEETVITSVKHLNKIKIKGRGGTDFKAIEHFMGKEKVKPKKTAILILTDGGVLGLPNLEKYKQVLFITFDEVPSNIPKYYKVLQINLTNYTVKEVK